MNEDAVTQLTISPEIEPIKLQPGERLKHLSAFELYTRIRSIRDVAKVLNIKNPSIVSQWSMKYHWVERTRELDEAVSKVMAKSMIESQIESNKKHISIIDEAIDQWDQKLRDGKVSLNMVQDIEKLINMRNKLTGQDSITDQQGINVNITFK